MVLLLTGVLVILIASVSLYYISLLKKEIYSLKEQHILDLQTKITEARTDAKKRSTAVQWGKSIEHFVPFTSKFPIPVEDVSFLGMPIDYVGFTDTGSKTKCAVHFVEVKSGNAFLMAKQKNIKTAILEKRVHWHEISIESNTEE